MLDDNDIYNVNLKEDEFDKNIDQKLQMIMLDKKRLKKI